MINFYGNVNGDRQRLLPNASSVRKWSVCESVRIEISHMMLNPYTNK